MRLLKWFISDISTNNNLLNDMTLEKTSLSSLSLSKLTIMIVHMGILMSYHSNRTWLLMLINLQLETSDFVDVDMGFDHCHGSSKNGLFKYLLQPWKWSQPKHTSTKSEVCNCKLMRINNQVLLDDGKRIIIPQGNFKASFVAVYSYVNVDIFPSLIIPTIRVRGYTFFHIPLYLGSWEMGTAALMQGTLLSTLTVCTD